jgi:SAM-dependent methyltransferase
VSSRSWTVRRIAGGVGRRVPVRPLGVLVPFGLSRSMFRLWLRLVRDQADKRKAMRELLEIYADAYEGVDRGAIVYGEGVHVKHRLTQYHDFFVEHVRPGEVVLDIGCGKGELAYDLAERAGANVIAIDRARWALDYARDHFSHPRVRYVEADALVYVVEDALDVVVLSNVLEHVGPRIEILRSLRTRGVGRLLIRVPMIERDWIVPLREELGLPHFSDPEHEVEYTPELLMSELESAGWVMSEPSVAWGEIWVEATPRAAGSAVEQ